MDGDNSLSVSMEFLDIPWQEHNLFPGLPSFSDDPLLFNNQALNGVQQEILALDPTAPLPDLGGNVLDGVLPADDQSVIVLDDDNMDYVDGIGGDVQMVQQLATPFPDWQMQAPAIVGIDFNPQLEPTRRSETWVRKELPLTSDPNGKKETWDVHFLRQKISPPVRFVCETPRTSKPRTSTNGKSSRPAQRRSRNLPVAGDFLEPKNNDEGGVTVIVVDGNQANVELNGGMDEFGSGTRGNKRLPVGLNYFCNNCQRGFLSKAGLGSHKKAHSRLYQCKLCEFSNSLKKTVNSHFRQRHPDQIKNVNGNVELVYKQ